MPGSWGWVQKIGFTGNGDFSVLFFTQSSGPIYRKSGNGSYVSGWYRVSKDSLDAYPVGAVYISMSSTSPASLFGGTWEQLLGRFLLGVGHAQGNNSGFYGDLNKGSQDYWSNSGSKAGQFYHTLTAPELPQHNHYFDNLNGGWVNPTVDCNKATTWGASFSDNHDYKIRMTNNQHMDGASGQKHNNMPPFITVYMWKRTA